MRVFSGIRASGDKTLGNYSGGFRQYLQTQDEALAAGGEAFFCVVDLHSITTPFEPEVLRESTLSVFAWLIATGVDPARSTVFAQSHVPAHPEGAWLLGAVTSLGELRRMTQFKDRAKEQDFVSAGLFTYPVLMAADILLYNTDVVPVGDDQRQHVELTRDIAERFNQRFGETLVVPRGVYPEEGSRIKNLQEPDRLMSTTRGAPQGVVRLIDPPDVIRKKFKTAVTDSGREVKHDPEEKAGVSNLIEIMAVATGASIAEVESRYDGAGYGPFKEDVGEAVVTLLTPFQERYDELRVGRAGAARADEAGSREGRGRREPDARSHVRTNGLRPRASARARSSRRAVRRGRHRRRPSLTRTRTPCRGSSSRGLALAGLAYVVGVVDRVGRRALSGLRRPAFCSRRSATCPSSSSSSSRSPPARSSSRTTAVLGSLFANALLVLGLAIVAGAGSRGDGIMRFKPRLPNDTATLLLLAVFIIVLLGISHEVGRPGERARGGDLGRSARSRCSSVYVGVALGLPARRRAGRARARAAPRDERSPFRVAVGLPRGGRRRRGVRLRLVRRRARPGDRDARDLPGVHGPRDRGDRRQRGRERRRHHARGEGPERSRDLGDQELGRADRGRSSSRCSCCSRSSSSTG